MRAYPRHLPGLTSLRFIAAMWIVVIHYVWWLSPVNGRPINIPTILQGGSAVDFFFILSGFILTHAHYEQLKDGTLIIGSFTVKRVARTYPLHLATLLFYLALIVCLSFSGIKLPNPDRYTAGSFFVNLAMLQSFQLNDTGYWNFPSWSISAEWFAYALFPFLANWLVRRLARVPAVVLLASGYLMLLLFYALAGRLLGRSYFVLHAYGGWYRILPEFVLGIVLYRTGVECAVGWLGRRPMLLLIAGLVIAADALGWEIATVSLLAISVLATAEASRDLSRSVLDSRPLVYLGTVSFALYMVHLPVATLAFGAAQRVIGPVSIGVCAGVVLVAVLASIAAHHLVEQPAYRFITERFLPRAPTASLATEMGVTERSSSARPEHG